MRVVYEYSHLGGKQILLVDYPKIFQEIHEVINSVGKLEKQKFLKKRQ